MSFGYMLELISPLLKASRRKVIRVSRFLSEQPPSACERFRVRDSGVVAGKLARHCRWDSSLNDPKP